MGMTNTQNPTPDLPENFEMDSDECTECGHYHDGPEGVCSLTVEGCECSERWSGKAYR